jgi:3-isopropylmalate/(R)-2-methylmalate dehydratase small subunit
VFGDDIDTDVLAPGHLMKLSARELAAHCLEAVRPDFAGAVKPGDFVVAGRGFGIGSSREQAAQSLRLLGVSAVLARSFGRIFYRNAINLGLAAIVFPDACEIADGERLAVDPAAGRVENVSRNITYGVAPIPPNLLSMIEDGGLMAHLKRRRSAQTSPA